MKVKIRVWTLVMNLFEIGKKYKIIILDEDNGQVVYKCTVKAKDGGNLLIDVYETDGEEDYGQTWIKWRWILEMEQLEVNVKTLEVPE
ncbi:hypothetical protein ACTFRD_11270 [Bacillus cereus group sp. MYBK249-1]|nr:hypothetical protein [Bacillus thuringiensis]MEC3598403.1 hypothetical protein [Bacillus thuringiensis]MED1833279.1 hypothetical protein [Bacillus thuringiensis]MED2696046.1 hypothetical protein [Bacillus thuringiensis]